MHLAVESTIHSYGFLAGALSVELAINRVTFAVNGGREKLG
jgi:hypothetical protein